MSSGIARMVANFIAIEPIAEGDQVRGVCAHQSSWAFLLHCCGS
jgi:hypothetical protein